MKRILCGILLMGIILVTMSACNKPTTLKENQPLPSATTEESTDESIESEKNAESEKNTSAEEIVSPEEIKESEQLEIPFVINVNQTNLNTQYTGSHGNSYYTLEAGNYYFTLDDATAKQYPVLAKLLEGKESKTQEELKTTMQSLKEDYKELEDLDVPIWEMGMHDITEATVLRSDSKVFSYEFSNDSYYGGAHGSYYISGLAYDVETGELIKLSDVVKNGDRLKDIVIDQLDDDYEEDLLYGDLNTTIHGYELDSFTWSLDYQGVTIYFNQYEIGSYAYGMQEVKLPFAKYPELFEERFAVTPHKYVMEIQEGENQWIDVNGDGTAETVQAV